MLVRLLLLHCLALTAVTFASERATPVAQLRDHYDVIVAGAGTGGFGAAMQAARLGATVLLVEETDWIGGQMNAAAVTSMDEGPILVRERGLYREFVEAVTAYYQKLGISAETAYWHRHVCMEPRVGQDILYAMLEVARSKTEALHVALRARVTQVLRSNDAVSGVEISLGRETRKIQSWVLVDATEWGDVIPLTGARYRVGNCTSEAIDPKKQIQDLTWTAVIKQYPKGVPVELQIKAAPPGYTEAVHQAFVKSLVAGDKVDTQGKPWNYATFIGYRGMPNSEQPDKRGEITRTHLNYNNDFRTTVADVEDIQTRQATLRAAALKTLHLLYYIQHSLGKADWSVANDEGYDSPYNREQMDAWLKVQPELEPYRSILQHFPVMAYARESRRLIGMHTLTAREIERKPRQPIQFENTVALGDYAVDLHGSKKPALLELDLDPPADIPQGTFGSRGTGPFAIPFECFVPERIDGFLAAEKNISQSRLANGATRLQPSTMLMGQAVGAIAALAIKHEVQPRELDPVMVQAVLLETGDTLTIASPKDIARSSWEWKPVQLVTVRGLIPLENGKFLPAKPLSADVLIPLMKRMFDKDVAMLEPITRRVLARLLVPAMAQTQVKLIGVEAMAGPDETVTRLEAASLFAQFLQLRAQARMTRQVQSMPWPAPREGTPLKPADLAPQLAADLNLLVQHHVLVSPDYWLVHASEEATCDGKHVAALLRNVARKLQPGSDPANAIAVCAEEGLLGSAGYWSKNAVAGRTCSGANVATVIRRIAQRLAALKP